MRNCTIYGANNKDTDQTTRMRRLICILDFVVRIRQGFSWRGPFENSIDHDGKAISFDSDFVLLTVYALKNPKNSDPRKKCCNYHKIERFGFKVCIHMSKRCKQCWPRAGICAKIIKRTASRQNQQNDMCAQRWLRSAWASPSLIRVFAVRSVGSWGSSVSSCGQRRLLRLSGCPGWSESSLGAHAILLVLSWGGSNSFWKHNHVVLSR